MLHKQKVSLGRILLVKIHDNWTAHLWLNGVHGGNWNAIPLQLYSKFKYIEWAFIWAHKQAITIIFLWVISIYFFFKKMDNLLGRERPRRLCSEMWTFLLVSWHILGQQRVLTILSLSFHPYCSPLQLWRRWPSQTWLSWAYSCLLLGFEGTPWGDRWGICPLWDITA